MFAIITNFKSLIYFKVATRQHYEGNLYFSAHGASLSFQDKQYCYCGISLEYTSTEKPLQAVYSSMYTRRTSVLKYSQRTCTIGFVKITSWFLANRVRRRWSFVLIISNSSFGITPCGFVAVASGPYYLRHPPPPSLPPHLHKLLCFLLNVLYPVEST